MMESGALDVGKMEESLTLLFFAKNITFAVLNDFTVAIKKYITALVKRLLKISDTVLSTADACSAGLSVCSSCKCLLNPFLRILRSTETFGRFLIL